ncbi:20589_t:CDS:2, partial [Entrophospora sp. SA101]
YVNYCHRSTSGIAAYQTFTKQIMHETINKMIPDKCDDFNSNPGSKIGSGLAQTGLNPFTVNFEKAFDPTTGEELCICNILDKNGRCCKKTYKSFGYSTGNLKRHLDEVHGINEVEIVGERKKSQRKITDYSQVTHNHPPYIQKKKEEALLKWILKTNQPLSIVTNEAYIEKMKVFDPAFSVPGAKKLRTMIGNSYSFNKEALRGSYVTLSKMVPKIKELIFNLGDFYEASLLGGFGGNWNNPPPINNNPPPINETNSIPDIDDDE